MKINSLLIVLASFVISFNLHAQQPATDPVNKSEISKLMFLTGKWEGKGWMMGQDRQRHTFDQTEDLTFKLDSTLLVIEGHGKSDGRDVHDAFAIVAYNKESKQYDFTSFLANGQKGTFKAELKENKLIWYPTDNMTYIIEVNEKGQWHEIGEMTMNGNTFRFFEMTLDKVK